MSKPRNWMDMTREEQRAWQQQETAREDAEYEREQSERRAKQAERNAESARRASLAARSEYEENAENYRSEIEALEEKLCEARLQRDKLLAACKAIQPAVLFAETVDTTGSFTGVPELLQAAIKDAEDNPA